jgi:hypothetical protein
MYIPTPLVYQSEKNIQIHVHMYISCPCDEITYVCMYLGTWSVVHMYETKATNLSVEI